MDEGLVLRDLNTGLHLLIGIEIEVIGGLF
jgi:hypothetical protein